MASKLTIKFHLDLTTERAVQSALKDVIKGVQNRVLKSSIGKAARVGAKTAKMDAPRGQSGLLRASMGVKYKSYQGGNVWMFAVGSRMDGFDGIYEKPGGRSRKHRPFKIAHLAESGRGPSTPKPGGMFSFFTLKGSPLPSKRGGRSRARKLDQAVFTRSVAPAAGFHFMRSAFGVVQAQKSQIIRDIIDGIQKEAAKYAAKGKSIYGP